MLDIDPQTTIFPGIDVPRNDKEVYSLRYTDFIMPAIKAIQEQQALIEELKKKNEKLEVENNDIKQQYQLLDNRVETLEKILSKSE